MRIPTLPTRLARACAAEVVDALYPPLCWLCRRRGVVDGLGCAEHALLPCAFEPGEARCGGCALRLPEGVPAGPCARCRREPRGFRRLVAHGPYRRGSALREWLLALKHGGRVDLARPLAVVLERAWRDAGGPDPGALLVPVPLHPLRRLERGHDQAGGLCRGLAERTRLDVVRALRRVRWTAPQGAAASVSRDANVAAAFAPRRRAARAVAGRRVWLVDDVVTSGATARECARVLRRAGALEVSVLAVARVEEEGAGEGGDGRRPRGMAGARREVPSPP